MVNDRQVQSAEERGLLYRGKEGTAEVVGRLLFLGQGETFPPDGVCDLPLMPV